MTLSLDSTQLDRYSRHIIMDEVGPEGQRALLDSRVLVVGAGGLGSPVVQYLAAAGVGTLGVADADDVERSNLQRQVIHRDADVGRPKAESAREFVESLNPDVTVETHETRVDSGNIEPLLEEYDVVADCSDNFATRYLVNDACTLAGVPFSHGAILRFEGQVTTFESNPGGPCYRCLFPSAPEPGTVPDCATAGVLGVLPGVVGTIQATEVVKLLLGYGETLDGRFLIYDAGDMTFEEVPVEPRSDCPVCGDEPTVTELIDYEAFCGVAGTGTVAGPAVRSGTREAGGSAHAERTDTVQGVDMADGAEVADGGGVSGEAEVPDEIGAAELKDRLDAGVDLDLIDVREPFEWKIFNLEDLGAKLIPLNQLEERLDELDPEREIVFYCRSGARSGNVTRYLRQHGFDRARNLTGGILAWGDEVDPDTPRY